MGSNWYPQDTVNTLKQASRVAERHSKNGYRVRIKKVKHALMKKGKIIYKWQFEVWLSPARR